MFISYNDLKKEQERDLDYKIATSIAAIKSAFEVCRHRPALAFSAGKDSTVLWHLIRIYFPEEAARVVIIYGNTGVEYPECVKFAHQLRRDWGNGNFFEAIPGRTEEEGLKYPAQQAILDFLIRTDRIHEVLKPDGKLKSTRALEAACPPHIREEIEQKGLIWPAGTRKGFWWCVDQYGWPLLGKAKSKLKARRINIDCFLRFSKSQSEDQTLLNYYQLLR